jgi:hypothetical protein
VWRIWRPPFRIPQSHFITELKIQSREAPFPPRLTFILLYSAPRPRFWPCDDDMEFNPIWLSQRSFPAPYERSPRPLTSRPGLDSDRRGTMRDSPANLPKPARRMLMDPSTSKKTTISTQFWLSPTKLRDGDLSIPKAAKDRQKCAFGRSSYKSAVRPCPCARGVTNDVKAQTERAGTPATRPIGRPNHSFFQGIRSCESSQIVQRTHSAVFRVLPCIVRTSPVIVYFLIFRIKINVSLPSDNHRLRYPRDVISTLENVLRSGMYCSQFVLRKLHSSRPF